MHSLQVHSCAATTTVHGTLYLTCATETLYPLNNNSSFLLHKDLTFFILFSLSMTLTILGISLVSGLLHLA